MARPSQLHQWVSEHLIAQKKPQLIQPAVEHLLDRYQTLVSQGFPVQKMKIETALMMRRRLSAKEQLQAALNQLLVLAALSIELKE